MHRWLRIVPALFVPVALVAAVEGSSTSASTEKIALGKKTAEVVCASCHIFPEPWLLDGESWVKRTLPYMEPWLGRKKAQIRTDSEKQRIREAGVFPENAVIDDTEWEALNAYYSANAPAMVVAATNKPAAKAGSQLFRARALQTSGGIPATTLVKIDTNAHAIYVGDALEHTLKLVNGKGEVLRALDLPSAPVDVLRQGTNLWVPLVGRTFPSDEWAGQIRRLRETEKSWESAIVLSNLPRLVHASIADLNADGRPELILCGFGNRVGKLMVWDQEEGSEYRETALSNFPGAIATQVEDFNGDGAPDILLLRGQAREGVFLYVNRGDHFEEKPVIEFPPAFGTARWQVLDFNGDGKTDLLICNGDIGDYATKPRAYHGLRLYLGDGKGGFRQVWSFPMNGCYGARVADFDNDGDLDIAAISFFPNYENYPGETFLWLENKGKMEFEPHSFTFANQGRWLVMDAGDLDGDGDIDIALGSFVNGPRTIPVPDEVVAVWKMNRASVLILENTTK
jgi:hypothetical protein